MYLHITHVALEKHSAGASWLGYLAFGYLFDKREEWQYWCVSI
jgi:hypothetical protein